HRERPARKVVVSCVPALRAGMGWPGATVEAISSVGPIIEGTALNFTAWSYADRLCVGALACPDVISDLHAIVAGLHDALGALVTAAGAEAVGRRPGTSQPEARAG